MQNHYTLREKIKLHGKKWLLRENLSKKGYLSWHSDGKLCLEMVLSENHSSKEKPKARLLEMWPR